jgi:beta-phosphoglucomutase-like phosphatase (HAD superfamily)
MENKIMIKGIIFDMDGVLIDAKDWHYEALNQALALFGMEISRHDHLSTFDGLPTRKKLAMLSEERNLSTSLHDFINELKQTYTLEHVYTRCKPLFFHEYALSRLKKEGYQLALASNSVRVSVDSMMEKSHLSSYFSFTLSSEDVKEGKPSPEIYIKAMDKLNIKPNECIIIEDNINGIRAAIASGAHVMRVANVDDVNYSSIIEFIKSVEDSNSA